MNITELLVKRHKRYPEVLGRILWQFLNKPSNRFNKGTSVNFVNVGYSRLNGEVPLNLNKDDENNRYCIQMYDQLIKDMDLHNKDILEVGSGRGGGASYILRYYSPQSYTGLDISGNNISYCNQHYKNSDLVFVRSNAEKLSFKDHSFDVVLNVESEISYNNLEKFFQEVRRVLRPSGSFLLTERIRKEKVDKVCYQLIDNGFEIIKVKNITENVIAAFEKDSKHKEDIIKENEPWKKRQPFSNVAEIKSSDEYLSLKSRVYEYWSYVLKIA